VAGVKYAWEINPKYADYRDRATTWAEVLSTIDKIKGSPEIQINRAREEVLESLLYVLARIAADTTAHNMIIRKLPWLCGNCGQEKLQNLCARDDTCSSLSAVCDHCGSEFIS
jgi:hypothetical protein